MTKYHSSPRLTKAFDIISSKKTTIVLVACLCALFSVGLFVPQGISDQAVGDVYSSAIAQVVIALDAHHIARSWAMQLLSICMLVHVLGLLIGGVLKGWGDRQTPTRMVWMTATGLRASGGQPEQFVRRALPDWRIQSRGERRAVATRGMGVEGFGVTVIGVGLLISAWLLHAWLDVEGRIELVTGPADDAAVSAWFNAEKWEGNRYHPWSPGFTLSCEQVDGDPVRAERRCIVNSDEQKGEVTLGPGLDMSYKGYRLTLVGVHRDANVGGVEVKTTLDGQELEGQTASIGTPLPIVRAGKELATVVLSGFSSADLVAVAPSPGVTRDVVDTMKISVTPRTKLTFRVTTQNYLWPLWIGFPVLLMGLVMVLVLPGYRVYVTGNHEESCDVSIRWSGLLARPAEVLSQIHQQFGESP
jgi:hypothetical protein